MKIRVHLFDEHIRTHTQKRQDKEKTISDEAQTEEIQLVISP